MSNHTTTIREAVGVFHSAEDMEAAIEDLQENGFDRAEISLLASQDSVRAKLGHLYKDVSELEDDADVPRTAFVSTESIGDAEGALIGGLMYVGALAIAGSIVASGGTFGSILAGAITGGTSGGLFGGFFAEVIGVLHANHLQQQLDRGGLLVWVRTCDEAHEKRAVAALERNNGIDVHVHSIKA